MELTARVHYEEGSYWADVVELPGCFASGETFDELVEALGEAISFCLEEPGSPAVPRSQTGIEVAEMKIATSAALSPA